MSAGRPVPSGGPDGGSAATAPTDPWGRSLVDGQSQFGPLDGDPTRWPAVPMQVDGDADVVDCAVGFARAFSSEYCFTVWLIVVAADGWTTKVAVELYDMPPDPASVEMVHGLHHLMAGLDRTGTGNAVVAVLAAPDGGDRGARERAWTQALLDAAGDLTVRGVVAVGAHRARLLHSSASRKMRP